MTKILIPAVGFLLFTFGLSQGALAVDRSTTCQTKDFVKYRTDHVTFSQSLGRVQGNLNPQLIDDQLGKIFLLDQSFLRAHSEYDEKLSQYDERMPSYSASNLSRALSQVQGELSESGAKLEASYKKLREKIEFVEEFYGLSLILDSPNCLSSQAQNRLKSESDVKVGAASSSARKDSDIRSPASESDYTASDEKTEPGKYRFNFSNSAE